VRASCNFFFELSIFSAITVAFDGVPNREAGVLEVSQGQISLGQQIERLGLLGRLFQRPAQIF
jgi:hypothetical protein